MPPNFKFKGTPPSSGPKPKQPSIDDLPSIDLIKRSRTKTVTTAKSLNNDLIDTRANFVYQNSDPGLYIDQNSITGTTGGANLNQTQKFISLDTVATAIGIDQNSQYQIEIDTAIMQYKARQLATNDVAARSKWTEVILSQFKGEEGGTWSTYNGNIEYPAHFDNAFDENYNVEPVGHFSLVPGFNPNNLGLVPATGNHVNYDFAAGTIDFTNFFKAYVDKFNKNDVQGAQLPKYYVTLSVRFTNTSQLDIEISYRLVVTYHLIKARGL